MSKIDIEKQVKGPGWAKGDLLGHDGSKLDNLAVGANGEVLKAASGETLGLEWAAIAASEVAVTPAGDIAATDVQAALEELDTEKAAATHAHAGTDITSGTVATARLPNLQDLNGTLDIGSGGTGQATQTAAFDALAPSTTKGDLIVHDGSDNIRLAVGANGEIPYADSGETSGIRWDAAPTGTLPSGVQGQKISIGAGDSAYAADLVVLAEDYGAIGDGSTDDTAALQAALDAVVNTGKTLWLPNTYRVTDSLTASGSDYTLDGGGTINLDKASGTADILLITAGGTGVATGFNESLAKADRWFTPLTDVDVDSAATFAVGDYVQLLFNDGTDVFSQFTVLRNIAVNTLRFDDPVLIPVNATQSDTVLQQAVRRNIRIRNLTFTGTDASGTSTSRAIRATSLVDCTLENLRCIDFTKGAAINVDLGYGCTFRNIYTENSGGSESDFQCQNFSNSYFTDIKSVNANGFGPQWIRAVNCKFGSLISTGAESRAIKFQGCGWNHIESITASKSQTGTGLSISNACYSNVFGKVIAHDNEDEGLWLSGERNINNAFNYVSARLNDASNQISASAGDENNKFFEIDSDNVAVPQFTENIYRFAGAGTRRFETTITTVTSDSETLAKFERFKANGVVRFRTIRVRFAGVYTVTSSNTFACRLRLSGSTWHTLTTPAGSGTDLPFVIEWLIIVATIGGSGTAESSAQANFNGTLRAAAGTSAFTWDTTAERDLELSLQASAVSQSMSVRQFTVEVLV